MKNCIPPKILKEMSERRFCGKGLFEILKHIETCKICRSKIRTPTKEEILKRFKDGEPSLLSNNSVPSTRN